MSSRATSRPGLEVLTALTMRVWYVQRGSGRRRARLRWISLARRTSKTIVLATPRGGRVTFRRRDLHRFGLFETPIEAIRDFMVLAKHWRDVALDEVRRAEMDLAIGEVPAVSLVLRAVEDDAA